MDRDPVSRSRLSKEALETIKLRRALLEGERRGVAHGVDLKNIIRRMQEKQSEASRIPVGSKGK
jgi:hypothetical protein